jgi:hypothetical protein
MKNLIARNFYSYILFVAFVGVFVSLMPYIFPEPFLSKVTIFLYGQEYWEKAIVGNLNAHPFQEHAHRIFGALFTLSGLLQFSANIRKKYRVVHRIAGYVFMSCVLVVAIGGIIMAMVFPFAGKTETYSFLFFGLYLLYVIFRGFRSIVKRDWLVHQQWMSKAYLLGLSTITMRVFAFPLIQFTAIPMDDVFNISFWVGFCFNFMIVEVWSRSLDMQPLKATVKVSTSVAG